MYSGASFIRTQVIWTLFFLRWREIFYHLWFISNSELPGASLYLLANAYNPLHAFWYLSNLKKKIKPNIYTILFNSFGWGGWGWLVNMKLKKKYSSILHWLFFIWIICQRWYCSTAPLHSHLIIDFTFPFLRPDIN